MGARKAATKSKGEGWKVDWYLEDVILQVEKATQRSLEAVAARIDGLTKINIVQNDQVDTGFMLNSVYFATRDGSTYAQTMEDGLHPWNPKKHDGVQGTAVGQKAPEAPLPPAYDALVCVGANYAIFQEQQQPFLYPALLQAAAEAEGIIQKALKDA